MILQRYLIGTGFLTRSSSHNRTANRRTVRGQYDAYSSCFASIYSNRHSRFVEEAVEMDWGKELSIAPARKLQRRERARHYTTTCCTKYPSSTSHHIRSDTIAAASSFHLRASQELMTKNTEAAPSRFIKDDRFSTHRSTLLRGQVEIWNGMKCKFKILYNFNNTENSISN